MIKDKYVFCKRTYFLKNYDVTYIKHNKYKCFKPNNQEKSGGIFLFIERPLDKAFIPITKKQFDSYFIDTMEKRNNLIDEILK